MNILPKKSWHVLNRKNIQKVRDDEAAAKKAEEEKKRRAALAEQEAKIMIMRKRRKALEDEEEEGEEDRAVKKPRSGEKGKEVQEVKIVAADGHINFFSDLQTGVGADKANPEHVAEKKAEQEKFEKKIGLLTYLVDKDSSSSDPWYTKSSTNQQSALQSKRKAMADPLNDMMRYVKAKKKQSEDDKKATPISSVKPRPSLSAGSSSSSHHHHHSSHKKTSIDSKKTSIDKLREERRRREEAEKAKSEALLRRHYGLEPDPVAVEEHPQRYNSQFNPHLARVRR